LVVKVVSKDKNFVQIENGDDIGTQGHWQFTLNFWLPICIPKKGSNWLTE